MEKAALDVMDHAGDRVPVAAAAPFSAEGGHFMAAKVPKAPVRNRPKPEESVVPARNAADLPHVPAPARVLLALPLGPPRRARRLSRAPLEPQERRRDRRGPLPHQPQGLVRDARAGRAAAQGPYARRRAAHARQLDHPVVVLALVLVFVRDWEERRAASVTRRSRAGCIPSRRAGACPRAGSWALPTNPSAPPSRRRVRRRRPSRRRVPLRAPRAGRRRARDARLPGPARGADLRPHEPARHRRDRQRGLCACSRRSRAHRRVGRPRGHEADAQEPLPAFGASHTYVNLDAGLVRLDDVSQWTSQVYGIGEIGEVFDATAATLTLDLLGLPVRAFGGTSASSRARSRRSSSGTSRSAISIT